LSGEARESVDLPGGRQHAFIYDRYGNLLSSGTGPGVSTTTYAYDLADRLNSITAPDGSIVGFTFDAPGRHATRTGTTAGITTTLDTYSYLGSTNSVIVDVSTQGSGYTLNAALDSMGDRLATSATAGFAWIVPDLHGNVAAQCGASGTITDVFRYDPYGKIIGTSTTGSVPSPWRFGGRILESTTGSDAYDFGARAYVPDLGTFTSLDSVAGSAQNPLTLNRYLYALGNPATLVDPDGHCAYIDNYSGCEGLAADDWIKSAPTRKAATAKHHAQVQMAAILSSGMGGSTPTAATVAAAPAAIPRDCGFMGAGCIDVGGVARTVGGGIGGVTNGIEHAASGALEWSGQHWQLIAAAAVLVVACVAVCAELAVGAGVFAAAVGADGLVSAAALGCLSACPAMGALAIPTLAFAAQLDHDTVNPNLDTGAFATPVGPGGSGGVDPYSADGRWNLRNPNGNGQFISGSSYTNWYTTHPIP
jgi:RHS repeat-associated protein